MSDNCSIEQYEWNVNKESWDLCPPSLSLSPCLYTKHYMSLQQLYADEMTTKQTKNS